MVQTHAAINKMREIGASSKYDKTLIRTTKSMKKKNIRDDAKCSTSLTSTTTPGTASYGGSMDVRRPSGVSSGDVASSTSSSFGGFLKKTEFPFEAPPRQRSKEEPRPIYQRQGTDSSIGRTEFLRSKSVEPNKIRNNVKGSSQRLPEKKQENRGGGPVENVRGSADRQRMPQSGRTVENERPSVRDRELVERSKTAAQELRKKGSKSKERPDDLSKKRSKDAPQRSESVGPGQRVVTRDNSRQVEISEPMGSRSVNVSIRNDGIKKSYLDLTNVSKQESSRKDQRSEKSEQINLYHSPEKMVKEGARRSPRGERKEREGNQWQSQENTIMEEYLHQPKNTGKQPFKTIALDLRTGSSESSTSPPQRIALAPYIADGDYNSLAGGTLVASDVNKEQKMKAGLMGSPRAQSVPLLQFLQGTSGDHILASPRFQKSTQRSKEKRSISQPHNEKYDTNRPTMSLEHYTNHKFDGFILGNDGNDKWHKRYGNSLSPTDSPRSRSKENSGPRAPPWNDNSVEPSSTSKTPKDKKKVPSSLQKRLDRINQQIENHKEELERGRASILPTLLMGTETKEDARLLRKSSSDLSLNLKKEISILQSANKIDEEERKQKYLPSTGVDVSPEDDVMYLKLQLQKMQDENQELQDAVKRLRGNKCNDPGDKKILSRKISGRMSICKLESQLDELVRQQELLRKQKHSISSWWNEQEKNETMEQLEQKVSGVEHHRLSDGDSQPKVSAEPDNSSSYPAFAKKPAVQEGMTLGEFLDDSHIDKKINKSNEKTCEMHARKASILQKATDVLQANTDEVAAVREENERLRLLLGNEGENPSLINSCSRSTLLKLDEYSELVDLRVENDRLKETNESIKVSIQDKDQVYSNLMEMHGLVLDEVKVLKQLNQRMQESLLHYSTSEDYPNIAEIRDLIDFENLLNTEKVRNNHLYEENQRLRKQVSESLFGNLTSGEVDEKSPCDHDENHDHFPAPPPYSITLLKKRYTLLEEDISLHKKEKDDLRTEIDQLQEKILQLNASLSSKDVMLEELDASKNQILKLETQLAESSVMQALENIEKNPKLLEDGEPTKDKKDSWRMIIKDLRSSNDTLNQENKNQKQQIRESEAKTIELTEEVQSYKLALDTTRAEKNKAVADLEQLQATMRTITANAQEATEEYANLLEQTAEWRCAAADAEKGELKMKEEAVVAQLKLNRYKSELSTAAEELEMRMKNAVENNDEKKIEEIQMHVLTENKLLKQKCEKITSERDAMLNDIQMLRALEENWTEEHQTLMEEATHLKGGLENMQYLLQETEKLLKTESEGNVDAQLLAEMNVEELRGVSVNNQRLKEFLTTSKLRSLLLEVQDARQIKKERDELKIMFRDQQKKIKRLNSRASVESIKKKTDIPKIDLDSIRTRSASTDDVHATNYKKNGDNNTSLHSVQRAHSDHYVSLHEISSTTRPSDASYHKRASDKNGVSAHSHRKNDNENVSSSGYKRSMERSASTGVDPKIRKNSGTHPKGMERSASYTGINHPRDMKKKSIETNLSASEMHTLHKNSLTARARQISRERIEHGAAKRSVSAQSARSHKTRSSNGMPHELPKPFHIKEESKNSIHSNKSRTDPFMMDQRNMESHGLKTIYSNGSLSTGGLGKTKGGSDSSSNGFTKALFYKKDLRQHGINSIQSGNKNPSLHRSATTKTTLIKKGTTTSLRSSKGKSYKKSRRPEDIGDTFGMSDPMSAYYNLHGI